ncbi:MAG TPA: glycine dehydrogenase (aminomethyl-transferring), partial [Microthrixaceae bacterium]|nr:glycine dehydrogenase (aminomethyl-transferring) [Microthrixaceae bacterium]
MPQQPTTLPPFAARHIGPSESDVEAMLAVVGQASLDALVEQAVPGQIRADRALRVQPAENESAVIDELRALAARNTVARSMIGLGYYGTVTPPVVLRNVLENPAWYTAYTPYQPEISQGRLEALLNFQTMVADLTALPVANASMLDESSAAAEAVLLMRRASRATAAITVLDANLYPQTIAVIRGRAEALGFEVRVADLRAGLPEGEI